MNTYKFPWVEMLHQDLFLHCTSHRNLEVYRTIDGLRPSNAGNHVMSVELQYRLSHSWHKMHGQFCYRGILKGRQLDPV